MKEREIYFFKKIDEEKTGKNKKLLTDLLIDGFSRESNGNKYTPTDITKKIHEMYGKDISIQLTIKKCTHEESAHYIHKIRDCFLEIINYSSQDHHSNSKFQEKINEILDKKAARLEGMLEKLKNISDILSEELKNNSDSSDDSNEKKQIEELILKISPFLKNGFVIQEKDIVYEKLEGSEENSEEDSEEDSEENSEENSEDLEDSENMKYKPM